MLIKCVLCSINSFAVSLWELLYVWGGLLVSIIIQACVASYGGYKVALECNIAPVNLSL